MQCLQIGAETIFEMEPQRTKPMDSKCLGPEVSEYHVGQRVWCKNNGDSDWRTGEVTCINPLKVKVTQRGLSYTWDFVRAEVRQERRRTKPRNPRHFATVEGGRVYQALHIDSESVLDAPYRLKKCLRRSR